MGHNFSQGRVVLTIVGYLQAYLDPPGLHGQTPCGPGGLFGMALDLNSCFALNNLPIVHFYLNNLVWGLGQRGVFLPGSTERSSPPCSWTLGLSMRVGDAEILPCGVPNGWDFDPKLWQFINITSHVKCSKAESWKDSNRLGLYRFIVLSWWNSPTQLPSMSLKWFNLPWHIICLMMLKDSTVRMSSRQTDLRTYVPWANWDLFLAAPLSCTSPRA